MSIAQLVESLRYRHEGHGFDSLWCYWNCSLKLSFRPHCGPGVDSACNRNEYQEYFLGGKDGRCVGLTTLPPSCAFCIEIPVAWTSWSPNGLYRDFTFTFTFTFAFWTKERAWSLAKCYCSLLLYAQCAVEVSLRYTWCFKLSCLVGIFSCNMDVLWVAA